MLAVTGANGHLGSRLLKARPGIRVRALVRSPRAADQVEALALDRQVAVRTVDYRNPRELSDALEGCSAAVHLVGILKESRSGTYQDAHERTCAALAEAAAQARLQRVVYLSILGASPDSANACLASRGAAEQILLEAPVPATVIRVPMVLGEGDFASRALQARARRRWNLVLRASSLEQPIYAGDVVAALLAALSDGNGSAIIDLAGPESLPRAELIRRAAAVLDRTSHVASLPLESGLAAAWLLERVMANPPVTRAMLGVLDHDDRIDPFPAAMRLGVSLTPLDEALRRCLGAGL